MAPKNTTNAHYALSAVAALGSILCGYSAFAGPGESPLFYTQRILFVYVGVFMASAFGLGFLADPQFLLQMKMTMTFDKHHQFMGRFCGLTMLMLGYVLYAKLDVADGFQVAGLWIAGAGLLGPAYGILFLDPIMSPHGLSGDCFLILMAGTVGVIGTM